MKHALVSILLIVLFLHPLAAQTLHSDSISSGGIMRHFTVYIPKNYVAGSAFPLLIHLHGYGSNGNLERGYTNYMPVADTAGFLLVFPEGTMDANQKQFWNAGLIGFPTVPDDVLFISDLIDALHLAYNINLNRVYASGLSNGGYMCYQLAWKLSNKIAAIASVSGSMTPAQFAKCTPTDVVPVLEIHGTADNVVPYTSSAGTTDIDSLLRFWALADHCLPLAAAVALPDVAPLDGSTVVHYEWTAELANTACELYKIIGGAHVDWPGAGIGNNMDFSASPTIWQFFNRYEREPSSVKVTKAGYDFRIYPNPCSSLLHVLTDQTGTTTIIDMIGRIVVLTTENKIDVSGLLPGIYDLVFEKGGIRRMNKLIKL